jgi:hypothetical protein
MVSSLILVGWDGMKWINLSGAAGAGPYGGSWANGNTRGSLLRGSWQSGITALAIGSVAFILPVRLASFTGRITNYQAQLEWTTVSEENSSHFIVQASPDGVNWHDAGRIDAQNVSEGSIYTSRISQTSNIMRYRLLMVDRDGKSSYSQVISLTVNGDSKKGLKIFPNPVTTGQGALSIQLYADAGSSARVLIFDAMGVPVINQVVQLTPGLNNLTLETASLLPGAYILSFVNVRGRKLYPHQKLIKK